MPVVDFNNLVDDSGTGTTGTILDKAQLQGLLLGAVPAARTDTGAVNNWAPGLAGHTFLRWAGASDATISGLAGGVLGQRVTIKNTGTKVAYFLHQSGLSSAGNKFTNAATSAGTPIAPAGFISYQYDGTDWQLVAHEQGAWITPVFSAANFSSGGTTWTVDAGDVTTFLTKLIGRSMSVIIVLDTTTTAGGSGAFLNIAGVTFGGFSVLGVQTIGPAAYVEASTTPGHLTASSTGHKLYFTKQSGAAFGLGTNTIQMAGDLTFPVV